MNAGSETSSERHRVVVGGSIGLVVLIGSLVVLPWQLAVTLGWTVGASIVLLSTWRCVAPLDAERTHALATREDDSRAVVRGLLIGSATASLIAVLAALLAASRTTSHGLEVALTVTALTTVTVSWLTIQTVFMLRYAHLYYRPPVGGVAFPGAEPPSFWDFGYLAFTVGMTFQVSDTNIEAAAIRRVALEHALLAFVFAAVIIAIAINLVAQIVS